MAQWPKLGLNFDSFSGMFWSIFEYNQPIVREQAKARAERHALGLVSHGGPSSVVTDRCWNCSLINAPFLFSEMSASVTRGYIPQSTM